MILEQILCFENSFLRCVQRALTAQQRLSDDAVPRQKPHPPNRHPSKVIMTQECWGCGVDFSLLLCSTTTTNTLKEQKKKLSTQIVVAGGGWCRTTRLRIE